MPKLAATSGALATALEKALTAAGCADPTNPFTPVFYKTLSTVLLNHIDTVLSTPGSIILTSVATTTSNVVPPGQAVAGGGGGPAPVVGATSAPMASTGAGTLVPGSGLGNLL